MQELIVWKPMSSIDIDQNKVRMKTIEILRENVIQRKSLSRQHECQRESKLLHEICIKNWMCIVI
jgi:hypothetical protein